MKWEYHVMRVNADNLNLGQRDNFSTPPPIQDQLNHWGEQGWEAVGVAPIIHGEIRSSAFESFGIEGSTDTPYLVIVLKRPAQE